jgi:type I restriction enzyme S subunit
MCKRIFANQTNKKGGIPFYKIGTIGSIPDCYITPILFSDYQKKYSYPKKGEVLVTCAGTIGRCFQYDGIDSYFQDSNIVWIDNPKQFVDNDFLFYLISAHDWNKLNTTTITRLYNDDIRKIILSFPKSKQEQTKITSLFSAVNKRLEVQRKIIEEKEQLKRWVNNACLWNKDFPKVALNKIIKERNLRTTTVHQYQVLSSAVTGLYSQMDYFKHQISSENDVGYKVVLLNDVVFSPQNLWMGNINFNESFEIGMVSPSYKVYSVNDGFVPFYLSLFLKTARMKYEYSVCSEQGASVVRRNLNEDEFLQIAIPMPDFKTQAAAAKKLKLIVKTIEIEKQCLEALTKEKSFLLSNLFI